MSASEAYTAVPRFLSESPDSTDISASQIGAQALGLSLLPQGEQVARVMEAKREDDKPLYNKVMVQFARRSQKTTCIQIVLLGRCFTIPGYRVVQTAQTQAIASRVFRDMQIALESAYPDPDARPFTAGRSNGKEQIRWDNGSVWFIVAPKASAMRSQAADVLWFDEAGEYSIEQTQDLVEGALPLLDTRPHAQVIISGTPAKTRGGMLWDYLCRARNGKPRHGVVDYSMSPEDDPTDEALWWRVHPGLASGLTDIEVIRERFEGMPLVSFQREYLCADPPHASIAAIDAEAWQATRVDEFLPLPETGVHLAFACGLNDSSGAVAAAWMTDKGPVVQLLDYRPGISWMAGYLQRVLKDAPSQTIIADRVGSNMSVYTELQRKVKGNMRGVQMVGAQQHAAGVSLLMSAIGDQTLTHAADPALDGAAKGANFRYVQDSRLFGRRTSQEDVAPLEACALALYKASGTKTRTTYSRKAALL